MYLNRSSYINYFKLSSCLMRLSTRFDGNQDMGTWYSYKDSLWVRLLNPCSAKIYLFTGRRINLICGGRDAKISQRGQK